MVLEQKVVALLIRHRQCKEKLVLVKIDFMIKNPLKTIISKKLICLQKNKFLSISYILLMRMIQLRVGAAVKIKIRNSCHLLRRTVFNYKINL